MSQQIPPGLEGQIERPNPIELLWERHRSKLIAVGVLILAAIGLSYGVRYMQQKEVDKVWSTFAKSTSLDKNYTTKGEMYSYIVGQKDDWMKRELLRYYLGTAQGELVTKIAAQVEHADKAELLESIRKSKGEPTEPLLVWVAANRAALNRDWDEALAHLADLRSRFPDHFLCRDTTYPVQYRADKNKGKEPDEAQKKKKKKQPKADLEEPTKGSQVGLLDNAIRREREFRSANLALYEAPKPEVKPTVVIKTSQGTFKIQFYKDRAPKHVEQFVKLFREQGGAFYKGQRVDEIHRAGTEGMSPGVQPAMEFHLGLPSSRESDRDKWTSSEPSKTLLEFEDNDLSHYPGMVAAATEGDKKSSGERIWINANECAHHHDGKRVIFARVVDGLDIVKSLCESPFRSEGENRSGRGKPRDNIEIESVEVID